MQKFCQEDILAARKLLIERGFKQDRIFTFLYDNVSTFTWYKPVLSIASFQTHKKILKRGACTSRPRKM